MVEAVLQLFHTSVRVLVASAAAQNRLPPVTNNCSGHGKSTRPGDSYIGAEVVCTYVL